MNDTRGHKHCKPLRTARPGWWSVLTNHLTERCRTHIAGCPRCQRRLARIGRVDAALSLMRMQPQSRDLLARANTVALKYLKGSVRDTPHAERLRRAVPEPSRMEKAVPFVDRLVNMAACLFIVLMIRSGLTDNMFEIKEQGTNVMESYYARHLDNGFGDLYEDIFGQAPDHTA